MDLSMFPMFDKTITVLHKTKGKYHGLDQWEKKEYTKCLWQQHAVRTVISQTVSIGQTVICRIPEQPAPPVVAGDYVILGQITEQLITPDNIFDVINANAPNVITAKVVKNNTDIVATAHPLSPAFKQIAHHYVEGV